MKKFDMKNFIFDALSGTQIFENLFDTVHDILRTTTEDFAIASKIYGVLLPLGYTLVLFYFLLELLEKTTHEQFNLEVFIKMFIKLMFAEVFMDYGPELIGGFLSIGNWFLVTIKGISLDNFTNPIGVDELDRLKTAVNKMGIISQIAALGPALIIWILSKICMVVMKVQCWTIKLELALRVALSPIALADMFSEISRSAGIKYIKKILGTALQAGAVCAIYKIGAAYSIMEANTYVTSEGYIQFDGFIDMFIIAFCLIGATAISKQLINDELGN